MYLRHTILIVLSRSLTVNFIFIVLLAFYFIFLFIPLLFLEQLVLGLIGHAITSVTT